MMITALVILCLVGTNNAMPSYACADRRHRIISYVPRGGSPIDNTTDSPIEEDDDRVLIGVLDLRPTPGPDSILVLKRIMHGKFANDNELETVQQARFPLSQHDELSVTEEELNEQAASSNCIGNLCTTVYLIIEYDFDNGKTVLHRAFGGVKLMAFVDGVRSRWYEIQSSRITNLDEKNNDAVTKLIVLLVPSSPMNSSSSSTIEFNIDTASDVGCDVAGVTFLINRLSEAFALGGHEFQREKPFEVKHGIFHKGEENDEDMERQIIAIYKWRTGGLPLNTLSCSISNAYRNVGGTGIIEYQPQQT
jgi:hypothetical protein